MAKFEEDKIITALHPEKAEVGKKYWFADDLICLKDKVETCEGARGTLEKVGETTSPFWKDSSSRWKFIYPYEEPPKQRWTHKMLAEWCIKRNGQFKYGGTRNPLIHSTHEYDELDEEKEINKNVVIRPFGQTEWIEPTVDIYERDCKGGKE